MRAFQRYVARRSTPTRSRDMTDLNIQWNRINILYLIGPHQRIKIVSLAGQENIPFYSHDFQ